MAQKKPFTELTRQLQLLSMSVYSAPERVRFLSNTNCILSTPVFACLLEQVC